MTRQATLWTSAFRSPVPSCRLLSRYCRAIQSRSNSMHRQAAFSRALQGKRTSSLLSHYYLWESAQRPSHTSAQVYNLTTYPHLVGLFEELGVATEPSEMSFALSLDGGALEWASHGLGTIFAQRGNLLKPSFYRMIWDVVRFGQHAPKASSLVVLYGNVD